MRFSAAIQPSMPLRDNVAGEFLRKLFSNEAKPQPAPLPVQSDEPPVDLDQRVRLIGEW